LFTIFAGRRLRKLEKGEAGMHMGRKAEMPGSLKAVALSRPFYLGKWALKSCSNKYVYRTSLLSNLPAFKPSRLIASSPLSLPAFKPFTLTFLSSYLLIF
jgi:hypothetical protein